MSVETTEKTGRGGARGPRQFYMLKENPSERVPTDRDRVIGESIRKKAKEVTGQDISLVDVLAVKFTLSRWYEDPATKELLNDMDSQLKRAKAQAKREKAEALLREAEKELEEVSSDDDSDDDEAGTAEAADETEDDEDDEDDAFDDEDDKVSATF